jgi:hypothetical protein
MASKTGRVAGIDERLRFFLNVGVCQLYVGGIDHVCEGGRQIHHVFNDSLTQKNPDARKITYLPEFLAVVCGSGNVNRVADTTEARRELFRQAVESYGREHIWALASQLPLADWGYADLLEELEDSAP